MSTSSISLSLDTNSQPRKHRYPLGGPLHDSGASPESHHRLPAFTHTAEQIPALTDTFYRLRDFGTFVPVLASEGPPSVGRDENQGGAHSSTQQLLRQDLRLQLR